HPQDRAAGAQRPAGRYGLRRRETEGGGDDRLLARAGGQVRGHHERGGALMKVRLTAIAHARSGDKGDTANVGVIALENRWYPILERYLTAERVQQHFAGVITGHVDRFELPNLGALNFLLHGALGGGGTLSLKTD